MVHAAPAPGSAAVAPGGALMRALVLFALVACDREAKPVPALGSASIPCTAGSHALRRKESAALLAAHKVDAALELLSRASCGPSEEQSQALVEQIAWSFAEHADALFLVGDFESCERIARPNTMPDGYASRYFEPSHPVIKSFERTAKRCEEALAQERALFVPPSPCSHYKPRSPLVEQAFGLPDGTACLVVEKCGDTFLVRENTRTKLTVPKGNLVDPAMCGKRSMHPRVGFGRDNTILVGAGGREYDGVTWHPYARHLYRLEGTTLVFVREVRTLGDLETR